MIGPLEQQITELRLRLEDSEGRDTRDGGEEEELERRMDQISRLSELLADRGEELSKVSLLMVNIETFAHYIFLRNSRHAVHVQKYDVSENRLILVTWHIEVPYVRDGDWLFWVLMTFIVSICMKIYYLCIFIRE